jgi:hypothetical protein
MPESNEETAMLELITDLPENVLGIRARGDVTADDYQSVLVPAVEARLRTHKKLRLLYVLGPEFEGYTGPAAWEDTKVGMRHFTDFDRIAVVTDVDWVSRMVRAFGFVVPGDVRVFPNDDADRAKSWICEAPAAGRLDFELLADQGVLILKPNGALTEADFRRVSAAVDPYIVKAGKLSGLVIAAESFPGWEDFTAFMTHFRFIRDHRDKVRRIAVVTDSRFLATVPQLAGVFLDATVKHFPPEALNAGINWAALKAAA